MLLEVLLFLHGGLITGRDQEGGHLILSQQGADSVDEIHVAPALWRHQKCWVVGGADRVHHYVAKGDESTPQRVPRIPVGPIAEFR